MGIPRQEKKKREKRRDIHRGSTILVSSTIFPRGSHWRVGPNPTHWPAEVGGTCAKAELAVITLAQVTPFYGQGQVEHPNQTINPMADGQWLEAMILAFDWDHGDKLSMRSSVTDAADLARWPPHSRKDME